MAEDTTTTDINQPEQPEPHDTQADDAAFAAAFDADESPAAPARREPEPDREPDRTAEPATGEQETDEPDPAHRDETAPEQQADDVQAQPATQQEQQAAEDSKALTIEQKAHGYDSMLGRLEAERARRREIEDRLARLEKPQQPARQQQPVPPTAAATAPREISPKDLPEDMVEGVKEFGKKYPQYAAVARQDSPDGARIRDLISNWSPDIAAMHAENLSLRSEMSASVAQVQQRLTAQSVSTHNEQILQRSPDLAAVATVVDGKIVPVAEKQQAYTEYFNGLSSWLDEQPYKVASRYKQVLSPGNGGTAAQVAEVLQAYHDSHNPGASAPTHPTADTRALDAAAAVPSTPARVKPARVAKRGFDAGWDEAPDD